MKTVFTCRHELEDMMTTVYTAWASGLGHASVRLELEPVGQQELFCEYIHVEPDPEKSSSVLRSVQKKISGEAYREILYAAAAEDEDVLDAIYRFLVLGFHYGRSVTQMMTYQPVMRIMELSRKTGREAHAFREFARFTSIDGKVYVSHIEPKSNILLFTAEHFADRMPSEHWIMIDDTRKLAAIHPKDEELYLRKLTEEEFLALSETEKRKDLYTDLWSEFFHTIGIEARKNPKCQQNMMPLWYRKHAVEFHERS